MKKYIAISLLLVLSQFILPMQVLATVEYFTVNGEGTHTAGTYVGGAGTWTNLNSNDGDTSYLDLSASSRHSYNFTNIVSTQIQQINSVTLYMVAKAVTNYSILPFATISGTDYDTSYQALTVNYTTYSYTWAKSPATGLNWTTTELNAAQFGIYAPTGTIRWTYAYVYVDYTHYNYPSVTTSAATSVLVLSATLNGSITATNGDNCTRGFVWDTVSYPVVTDNATLVASGYATNWTDAGTHGAISFGYSGAVFAGATTYYYRSWTANSFGRKYGAEISFMTLSNPAISTQAVTLLARTTVRLNALVTSDGGQAADIRFGYDIVTGMPGFIYANTTAWVNNTYTTGSTPYVDITGLTPGTPYFFNVQIRNDAGTVEGAELTFTTPIVLDPPATLSARPYAITVSLSWTTGAGSPGTMSRYKVGTSAPTTTADGTLVCMTTNAYYSQTGLTAGTTYSYSAWGYSGITYSGTYSTTMITTLAADAAGITYPTPPSSSEWIQAPSTAKVSNLPFAGFLADIATAYAMPLSTVWIIAAVFLSVAGGLYAYSKNQMIIIALAGMNGVLVVFIVLGILSQWMVIVGLIIALGIIVLTSRI